MVVLAIAAGLTALAASAMSGMANRAVQAEAMRVTAAIRMVHARAAINGMRYQLVIDLDGGSFRVECSADAVPLQVDEARRPEPSSGRSRRRSRDDQEIDPFGLGAGTQATLDDCSEDLLPPTQLRRGTRFARVVTTHHQEPVEEGTASIGFFPNGFVEQSMIWLSDERGESWMTLRIDPMSARVFARGGDLDMPREFHEVEED